MLSLGFKDKNSSSVCGSHIVGLYSQSFLVRLKNDLVGGYSGNKVRGWVGELLLSESVTFLGSWHHPFTQAVHNKHYFTHRYLCTLFHNSNTITSEWVGGCRQSPSTQRWYWGIKPNPARQCFWKDSIFFNPFMNALTDHFYRNSIPVHLCFVAPSINWLVSLLVCANVGV